MSLDKAILHKKEKREPYRKTKATDATCRNHGTCKRCEDNRTYQARKAIASMNEKELFYKFQ